MRSLALTLLCCGPLMAAPPAAVPPRNQVPHPDVDQLRARVGDQDAKIAGLNDKVARLEEKAERLDAARAAREEELARLRAQAEELRKQVAALEREVLGLKGNRKELVGAWKVLSAEEDGVSRPPAVARLVFAPGSVTFEYREPGRRRDYAYKLDPTGEPKEIDVSGAGPWPTPGIYDLRGDRLTLCVASRRAGRPAGFSGPGTTLYVLERVAGSTGGGTISPPSDVAPPPR